MAKLTFYNVQMNQAYTRNDSSELVEEYVPQFSWTLDKLTDPDRNNEKEYWGTYYENLDGQVRERGYKAVYLVPGQKVYTSLKELRANAVDFKESKSIKDLTKADDYISGTDVKLEYWLNPLWDEDEDYNYGDVVRHNGLFWRALKRHSSEYGKEPGNNSADTWERIEVYDYEYLPGCETRFQVYLIKTHTYTSSTWASGKAYSVDEAVWYNSKYWVCRKAHTSTTSLAPSNESEYWDRLYSLSEDRLYYVDEDGQIKSTIGLNHVFHTETVKWPDVSFSVVGNLRVNSTKLVDGKLSFYPWVYGLPMNWTEDNYYKCIIVKANTLEPIVTQSDDEYANRIHPGKNRVLAEYGTRYDESNEPGVFLRYPVYVDSEESPTKQPLEVSATAGFLPGSYYTIQAYVVTRYDYEEAKASNNGVYDEFNVDPAKRPRFYFAGACKIPIPSAQAANKHQDDIDWSLGDLGYPEVWSLAGSRLAILKDAYDITVERAIDTWKTLKFSVPKTQKNLTLLRNEERIKYDGVLYVIKNDSRQRDQDGSSVITLSCPSIAVDLNSKYNQIIGTVVAESIEPFSRQARDMIDTILEPTLWVCGEVEADSGAICKEGEPDTTDHRSIGTEWNTVVANLGEVKKKWEGYIEYDERNRRVNLRQYDINHYKTGMTIAYGKNLKGITRDSVSDDFVTRLYCYGSEELTFNTINSEGTILDDTAYNSIEELKNDIRDKLSNTIEFTDSELDLALGISQSFIQDFTYFIKLGYKLPDIIGDILINGEASNFVRVGKLNESDYVDKQALYNQAKKKLKKELREPVVSYTLSYVDLKQYYDEGFDEAWESINIGDWIRIIDRDLHIEVDAMVVKKIESKDKPADVKIEVANSIESIGDILANTVQYAAKLAHKSTPDSFANYIKNAFSTMINSAQGTVIVTDSSIEAIELDEAGNPTKKGVRLTPGGIGYSNDGFQTYKNAITGDGILASSIYVTDEINLTSGEGNIIMGDNSLTVYKKNTDGTVSDEKSVVLGKIDDDGNYGLWISEGNIIVEGGVQANSFVAGNIQVNNRLHNEDWTVHLDLLDENGRLVIRDQAPDLDADDEPKYLSQFARVVIGTGLDLKNTSEVNGVAFDDGGYGVYVYKPASSGSKIAGDLVLGINEVFQLNLSGAGDDISTRELNPNWTTQSPNTVSKRLGAGVDVTKDGIFLYKSNEDAGSSTDYGIQTLGLYSDGSIRFSERIPVRQYHTSTTKPTHATTGWLDEVNDNCLWYREKQYGDKWPTSGSVGIEQLKGTGYAHKGDWVSGTEYGTYPSIDCVLYNGTTYYCKLAHTSSSSILPTDTTYWGVLANKGDKGNTGSRGPAGTVDYSRVNEILDETYGITETVIDGTSVKTAMIQAPEIYGANIHGAVITASGSSYDTVAQMEADGFRIYEIKSNEDLAEKFAFYLEYNGGYQCPAIKLGVGDDVVHPFYISKTASGLDIGAWNDYGEWQGIKLKVQSNGYIQLDLSSPASINWGDNAPVAVFGD